MKLHRQLFLEYTKMYRPYLNQINSRLTPFNLSVSHWSVLRLIFYGDAWTVSDIAVRQKIERPTTTKIIQRLKELGYVEVQSGKDRRTKIILLTKKGKEVCYQIRESLDVYQQHLLQDLSEEEQLTVVKVLHNISQKIMEDEG